MDNSHTYTLILVWHANMDSDDKELLELSVPSNIEEDIASHLNSVPKDNKSEPKNKSCTTFASLALVIAIVALFILTVIGLSFSIYGTESASTSSQDNFQSISTLQTMIQNLQVAIDTLLAESEPGTFRAPVRSCSNIPPGNQSGNYWIQTSATCNPVQVYCSMNRTSCSCNNMRGWMRIANLDMSDPNQNCPAGFQLVNRSSAPLRTCGRPGPAGCVSTTFRSYGMEYSHVCGQVIGYQDQTPDAYAHHGIRGSTVDSVYVDGVSLTHGRSPRQHIWTFVGAHDEEDRHTFWNCPCTQSDLPYTGRIPTFVEQNYFCDTGSTNQSQPGVFYANSPLWDGEGCGSSSTCCEFNNPPWFCRQLPQSTTDDIELRLCGDESTSNEDTPIEKVEIYIR